MPTERKSEPKAQAAADLLASRQHPGVSVDSLTRRDASDVLLGHFAVTKDGLYGVYEENVTVDSDGYPKTVKFRTRDENNEVHVVPYADLSPTVGRGNAPR